MEFGGISQKLAETNINRQKSMAIMAVVMCWESEKEFPLRVQPLGKSATLQWQTKTPRLFWQKKIGLE